MICLVFAMFSAAAAEYTAPDKSFGVVLPSGWRAREAGAFTVLEPANGGEERILIGSGVALSPGIQALSQQAMQIAGQYLQGAVLSSSPKFDGGTFAEQEYKAGGIEAWNGMRLVGGRFYFAALAMARPGQFAAVRAMGKQLFAGLRFDGVPRDSRAEAALVGRWSKSSYTSRKPSSKNRSNYTSSWRVQFYPGNRFHSVMENYFDTESKVYGGGSSGSSQQATGAYQVFGKSLVAEFDGGAGRQVFLLEFVGNNGGIQLNGQLFLRD